VEFLTNYIISSYLFLFEDVARELSLDTLHR
jgi:hypothetical protein